jgi:hypothetical protein
VKEISHPNGERVSSTHWTGNWMDPIAGLDLSEKRKISYPVRKSISGNSICSPITSNNNNNKKKKKKKKNFVV